MVNAGYWKLSINSCQVHIFVLADVGNTTWAEMAFMGIVVFIPWYKSCIENDFIKADQ